MGVIFLLSGKVFVKLSQSCLLVNQPDSDLRLIPKGQYQLIWGTARNCPGFMVGADLCIGRAFIDLEKFWGVQVKWGTLSSHWGALPTDTCTRMLCSYRGRSWMSACKQVLPMGVRPAPPGEWGKHRFSATSLQWKHSWLKEMLRLTLSLALPWLQWRWKGTGDGDLRYQYLSN